jgi:hypothetical protein
LLGGVCFQLGSSRRRQIRNLEILESDALLWL